MNKYEKILSLRRIYKLPDGKWIVYKDEFESVFLVGSMPKGMIQGWRCSQHFSEFGWPELRRVHQFDLSGRGMQECLQEFGPFTYPFNEWGDILKKGESLQGPAFTSWWEDAIMIQRAYSLFHSVKNGRFLRWEPVFNRAQSYYRLLDWPEKLRPDGPKVKHSFNERGLLNLSFDDVPPSSVQHEQVRINDGFTSRAAMGFGKALKTLTPGEVDVSRTMGKILLAKYIDNGLRESSRALGFAYNPARDVFRVDVAENEILDLKQACWLVLRDLASGISGQRFCKAPECTNDISRLRKGANVCSNTCQKRLDAHKEGEALRLIRDGYSVAEIVEDLNSRQIGKITTAKVKKWTKGVNLAKKA